MAEAYHAELITRIPYEAPYGYDLGPGAEDGTVYVSAYADYETGIVSAPYY